MRHLIITKNEDGKKVAYLTNYYDHENHYMPEMIVVDTIALLVSFDGETWEEVDEDHL